MYFKKYIPSYLSTVEILFISVHEYTSLTKAKLLEGMRITFGII